MSQAKPRDAARISTLSRSSDGSAAPPHSLGRRQRLARLRRVGALLARPSGHCYFGRSPDI